VSQLSLRYALFWPSGGRCPALPASLGLIQQGARPMRHADTGSFVMYSRSFLASVAVLSFLIPSLASAEEVTPQSRSNRIVNTTGTMWLGFAVSPNRRPFKSEPLANEMSARNSAKNECETTTLRTCSVIAVPEMADVSAIGCTYNGRSKSFLGGSRQEAQRRMALDKANSEGFPASSCVEFYTY
jgi:hypothetical protein